MSYAEANFAEKEFTPVTNIIQLMSAPICSFIVVTPLCILSGYSVPAAFLVGWVFGLLAMGALIATAYIVRNVREMRETAHEVAEANAAILKAHIDTNLPISPMAEWHLDALADRLDAICQSTSEKKYA